MTGILEVLYCVLIESPEVLNIIQENHIKSIISLLDKHGRNHKVRKVTVFKRWEPPHAGAFLCFRSWMFSAPCVCATVLLSDQIRTSSQRICFLVATSCFRPTSSTMQPGKPTAGTFPASFHADSAFRLLLCLCSSMRPNIFLGTCEGSTQYKKWYFEVMVDHVEPFLTAQPYHLRVGWALTEGYSPYPGGGEGWGGNGVGDDLYSYGFDGLHLWSGTAVHPTGRLIFWFHLNIPMKSRQIPLPKCSFMFTSVDLLTFNDVNAHRACSSSRGLAQPAHPNSGGRGQLLFGPQRSQYFLPDQRPPRPGNV